MRRDTPGPARRSGDAPLDDLAEDALLRIFQIGQAAGLEMHKFKRTMGLARVRRVFGVLRSLAPEDLLDVGSGRGAFLWPLLDEFPDLPVTAIDEDPIRARDIQAVRLGGIDALTGHQMDATKLDFPAGSVRRGDLAGGPGAHPGRPQGPGRGRAGRPAVRRALRALPAGRQSRPHPPAGREDPAAAVLRTWASRG